MMRIIREMEQRTYIEPSKMTVSGYLTHWVEVYGVSLGITMDTYPYVIKGLQQDVIASINEQLAIRNGTKTALNAKNHP